MFLLIYVDDIIMVSSSVFVADALLHKLRTEHAIKDIGPFRFFLGIDVRSHDDGLLVIQDKYTKDLLCKLCMGTCKPVATPLLVSEKLSAYEGQRLHGNDITWYRSIVGALQYLTLKRPDISFPVNKVCQFLKAPTDLRWTTVKHILRYLQHTLGLSLHIQKCSVLLSAFSDVDWVGSSDDRRSIQVGMLCFFLAQI